jgi:hypothetical protein
MGRGENEKEITNFLIHLRDEVRIFPDFFISDYKPSWELVINRIFPGALIIRCAFHTVQLINRAIVNELNRESKVKFKSTINQIKYLYQSIKKDKWNGTKIEIEFPKYIITEFREYYYSLANLIKFNNIYLFQKNLNSFIADLKKKNTISSERLHIQLVKRLPINGLTQKNLKYYIKKVKAALSLIMREFRINLEDEKRAFNKMRFLLLKRPEKLTIHELRFLLDYLHNEPEFKKYRDLLMNI